jgi:hypothetical protein
MNHSFAVLPSAARANTAASTAALLPLYYNNANGNSLYLVIDVTAVTSLVVSVVGWDATSGKTWPLITSAAIVGPGTTVLKVFAGATPAANLAVNDILPTQWGITATHAASATYSIGAHVLDI